MLEIDHLNKRFGSLQALKDTTFHVNPGELFGFVGSNGAGKTTTMRIILGVLNKDSGDVRWKGQPLDFALRQRIGYMPEERGLYPRMKVGDQLVYLAQLHGLSKSDAVDAMERWTDRLGIAARRDDHVQKLSLGNQQRVQLSAALVHDPEIMVLDEPFSGLDPVAVDVMSNVLHDKVATGCPVIFSSHQLDLVERLCDRVGIISDGSIVAEGTIADLRSGDRCLISLTTTANPAAFTSIPGVTVVENSEPGVFICELADTVDDQDILRAALSTGSVSSFGPVLPHLSDLYRDVVTSPDANSTDDKDAA